jgi:hypothetical protein
MAGFNIGNIKPPKAPNLPVPPSQYSQEYFNLFDNALRLYFNQLDKVFQYIVTPDIGLFYNFPHIAASDSTDQVATGNNTPTVVNWNTLDSGLGWTLNAPGSAIAGFSGVYTIRYSLQFVNTANAIHSAVVWIKVNGVDLANSATEFSVPERKSALVPSYIAAYSEATFTINAGDEIELYWATDLAGNPTTPTDGVYIYHDTAQTVPYARPAIPSAIGSITFVSAN